MNLLKNELNNMIRIKVLLATLLRITPGFKKYLIL